MLSRDQYPWAFGEAVLDIARNAIKLRYRLLPYIYSAFVRASETGAPVQRALAFDYQYDGTVADIDDEYLFGPDLLVAPVVEAGATARQVYLPSGRWYDWHTGQVLDGARYLAVPAPMDRIPIFARAGAVVPMFEEAPPTTRGLAPRSIELNLFVPARDAGRTESLLQEDDGLTFAALGGAIARADFTVERDGDVVTLAARASGAGFGGFCRERFVVVVHGATPTGAELEAGPVPVEGNRISLPVGSRPFRLAVHVRG